VNSSTSQGIRNTAREYYNIRCEFGNKTFHSPVETTELFKVLLQTILIIPWSAFSSRSGKRSFPASRLTVRFCNSRRERELYKFTAYPRRCSFLHDHCIETEHHGVSQALTKKWSSISYKLGTFLESSL